MVKFMNKDEENNLINNELSNLKQRLMKIKVMDKEKEKVNDLRDNQLQDLLDLEILYLEDLADLGQRLKVLKHLANDANSRIAFQIAAEAQIAMEPWKFQSIKWKPDLRHERKKEKFSLADFKKKIK